MKGSNLLCTQYPVCRSRYAIALRLRQDLHGHIMSTTVTNDLISLMRLLQFHQNDKFNRLQFKTKRNTIQIKNEIFN